MIRSLLKYIQLDKNLIFFLIFLTLFAWPCSAGATEAVIENVDVSLNPPVKVSFRVKDAFTEEIEEAIRSGMPTSFTYFVRLDRVRALWPDETIGEVSFKHTVKYDTLKEEYEVSLDERGGAPVRTGKADEMKSLMTTCTDVQVTPGAPLKAGEDYELMIKAELRAVDPPFLLKYMLFFMDIWDLETDWHTYRFTP